MSISSKITIQWVPSANALTQSVQRALASTGPWTTLVSGLGPTVNFYEDTTVIDNPFTWYYYRILTYCDAESAPTPSAVDSVKSGNCPGEGDSTIFGLWSTNGGLITSFNYYDANTEDFVNLNLGPTTPGKTVTSPAGKIRVVCHKCGELIQPTGAFAQYGDVSYLSNQNSIVQYLPTSPAALGGNSNFNLGTVYRKLRVNNSIIQNDTAHFGNGSGSTFNQVLLGSGTYTLKNHTQLRLGKYIFNSTTDQTAGLNALNNTNLYVAISDGIRQCDVYIYQAQRNSLLDITIGSNTMLGFNLTYVSSHVINGNYAIYSFPDTVNIAYSHQPNLYFKFFNL
jgi:hypothetical protein